MGRSNKALQKNIPNRDQHLLRMNYLYQISVQQTLMNNIQLGRYYSHIMKSISKKFVQRMDTSIKRTICKKCDVPLIPSITSQNRIRSKREKHVTVTCTKCKFIKRYNARKGHKLYSQKVKSDVYVVN